MRSSCEFARRAEHPTITFHFIISAIAVRPAARAISRAFWRLLLRSPRPLPTKSRRLFRLRRAPPSSRRIAEGVARVERRAMRDEHALRQSRRCCTFGQRHQWPSPISEAQRARWKRQRTRILAIIFERIVSFAASLARRDESCCRSSLGPVTNRCSFGISTSLARPLHSQHLTLRPAVSRSAEGLEQA